MERPVKAIREFLCSLFTPPGTGIDVAQQGLDVVAGNQAFRALPAGYRRNLQAYRRVEPSKQALFDLGQNPHERPRICLPGFPLFTLTAHTSCIWSPSLGRMLTMNEIATGQRLPCTPFVAGALGMPVLELTHLARTAACRLIGNGMTLCCVGAVALRALRWLKFDHGPVPRGVKETKRMRSVHI